MTDYTKLAKQLDAVNDAHGSQAVRDAAAILRQLSAVDVAGVMDLAMKWARHPFSTQNGVALEAAIRALAVRGQSQWSPIADAQPITWPKEKRVGRREDMSPDGHLVVGLDSDNDVYVVVNPSKQNYSSSIEFCNGGGGGGGSPRTRAALINLMSAIEADNAASPYQKFPPAPKETP